MVKGNGAAEASARRSEPPRPCPAPKILTATPCGRYLDDGQDLCRQHEGTDATRQCEGETGPARERIRCSAWPLVGLPFCRAHDPESRAERKAARAALTTQLGRVRALIRPAGPDVSRRVLELLVLRRRVTVADVVGALAEYRVGG